MNCELKYCERCGSLKLRRAGSGENYCGSCVRLLLHFLPALQHLRMGLAAAQRRRHAHLAAPIANRPQSAGRPS